MKESFDQQGAQSPSPSTGSRQTAHRRGKAISRAARSSARTLSAAFARVGSVGTIVAAAAFPEGGTARTAPFVAADEEALPFGDATLDLVVSALALQFVNDLPGTLVQIRRALKPDGLLVAALLGGETLTELRESFAAAESETTGGV